MVAQWVVVQVWSSHRRNGTLSIDGDGLVPQLVSHVVLVCHRAWHNSWGRHVPMVHHIHTCRWLYNNALTGGIPELSALTQLEDLYAAPLASIDGH